MHFKHIAIPLLYAISTPFAVHKYKIHLFSVLANEPTEIRLIFWLHGVSKNQLCPELLGGCYGLCAAAHCSRLCRSAQPSSAVLLPTCHTIKWLAYMQLHISSLYFSLPFSAWCKLNKIFLPQHCGFMSTLVFSSIHEMDAAGWPQFQEWHCWYYSLLAAELYVFIHHQWSLGSHSPKAHDHVWNISLGPYGCEKASEPPGKLPPLQLWLKFKLNCN